MSPNYPFFISLMHSYRRVQFTRLSPGFAKVLLALAPAARAAYETKIDQISFRIALPFAFCW